MQDFYRLFGEALEPDKKIFQSKKNIYKILSQFDATFLTTNADNLFEDILGHDLCHEDCKRDDITDVRIRRQNRLFYLHGHYSECIDINKNNLVFTAPQYVERYNDRKFREFLETVFRNNNVILFIGYGLNEFELIDYIVTKAGHTEQSPQQVYVLYGFCENDEIIFRAKKSYFEALNIHMIPFDMSSNGYDSLIDVLQSLYEDYRERTIVPAATIINESINEFNATNSAYILHCLKDNDKAFKGLTPVTSYQEKGVYKYTYGTTTDYNQILRTKKKVNEKFKDAFIVAFINGERVNTQQAIALYKENNQ